MPPKKTITKKIAKASTKNEPVAEPPVAEAAEAAEAVEATEEEQNPHEQLITAIDEEINGLIAMRVDLTNRIQSLRKIRKGVQGVVKKVNKKKKNKNTNKKPSGINMPYPITDISETLATFMKEFTGNPELKTVSRIDALKAINKYAKDKALQNAEEHTEIDMDAKLKKLFPTLVAQKKPLKYTGIMGPLGQHFPKKKKA